MRSAQFVAVGGVDERLAGVGLRASELMIAVRAPRVPATHANPIDVRFNERNRAFRAGRQRLQASVGVDCSAVQRAASNRQQLDTIRWHYDSFWPYLQFAKVHVRCCFK